MTITKKEIASIAKVMGVSQNDIAIEIAGALANAPRTKTGNFKKNIVQAIIDELFQKPLIICA